MHKTNEFNHSIELLIDEIIYFKHQFQNIKECEQTEEYITGIDLPVNGGFSIF